MKKILIISILVLIPVMARSQLAPVTSQYVLNPLTINPAFAGGRDALNIAAFYRRQWTGIPGAPETLTLEADAPFPGSKLGLGFVITNDKFGVTKETHFVTAYSYKISMNEGELSLGLGAGIIATNTKWSDLVVLEPGDENFLVDSRVYVVPDFSFGAYYSNSNYFGGISVPKLIGYRFDYNKNKYSLLVKPGKYSYLLHGGYVYTLNSKINLLPSMLVSITPGQKLLVDVNAYASMNDKIWGGLSYRHKRSLGVLLQFALNNQIRAAYTYDFDFGKLGRYSNGSHEIMLRYEFTYKINAVSPLNF